MRLSWMPKITNGFFMRAETFYHFASHLDTMPDSLRYYGGRSLHIQLHGEAFLTLFNESFDITFIIIYDLHDVFSQR